jgi:hypothetical protein
VTPGRRILAGSALVLLGLASTLAAARPATATTVTPGEPIQERTVVLGGDTSVIAPFAVDRLAPGSTVVQPLRVHLTGDILSGRPAVRIDHVHDLERGCLHPESAAGDVTCGTGDDQGELSNQLLTGVTWQSASEAGCAAVAGDPAATTMAAAAGVTQSATSAAVVGGADTCMLLTLTLPLSADNLVQSDSVLFDLQVGLVDAVHRGDLISQLRGASTGDGAQLPAGTHGSSSGLLPSPVLPFTGLPLLPFLLLTLGVAMGGFGAMSLGRPLGPTAT